MKHLLHKLSSMRLLMLLAVLLGMGSSAAWADPTTGSIKFGTNDTKISAATTNATDTQGNNWSITTVGTESFTTINADYQQIGSSKKPASSITFTTTLSEDVNITDFRATFGGFSGTAGTITLKVGETTVGTGSLNATNDVLVSSTTSAVGNTLTITVTDIAKGVKVYNLSYTYTTGGGDTPTLDNNDLALTDDPIALNFDLYNNSTAQVINYTTSSTGAVTIADNDYATFDIDEENKTITVTPTTVTPSIQTITVNQAADDSYKAGSATFKLTITDSTPIPTHTATFSVNGATTTNEVEEGATITFPENPSDVSGKTFVGWTTAPIEGTASEAPTFVTSATMGATDLIYYAVFAYASGGGSAAVVDELNRELTGVTSTTYSGWSGKTATSSAVYAGNTAGGNDAIQLRSNNNNSGIVTTTSGGKATKVTVKWNSNTSAGRTLNVYGKNSAYSTASDLYNSNNQGTLLGTIVYNTSTELTIDDDYEYIGIRSASGALYLDKVQITWSTGGGVSYSDYCTTVVAATVEKPVIEVTSPFTLSTEVTMSCSTEGATIYYTLDESEPTSESSEYTAPFSINATTTIKAIAIKGSDASDVTSVTATKNLAENTITVTGGTEQTIDLGDESEDQLELTATATNDATVVFTVDTENTTLIENDDFLLEGNIVEIYTEDKTGVIVLKANADGDDNYAAATEVTVTVNVINSKAPGSENNPYTVAQAIDAIDNGGNVTGVYVQGVISQIDSYASNYHSITYWISTDGTTTSTQFEVYSGKGLDGADFSSINDLEVGDQVVVTGDIKKYSDIYEFNYNNYIVSLTRKADSDFAISSETNVELEITSAELHPTSQITYTSSSTGDVIFVSNDDAVVTVSDEGIITAQGEGTTTITVMQEGDSNYKASAEMTIEVTVSDNRSAVATDIDLPAAQKTLVVGNMDDFTATGTVDAGFTGTVVYTYETSDASIVDVVEGTFSAEAPGTADITITATPTDGNAANYKSASQVVTVTVKGTTTLELSDTEDIETFGTPIVFTATIADGYDGVLLTESSNDLVATAAIEGTTITVTSQAVGTAVITVTAPETEVFAGEVSTYFSVEFVQPAASTEAYVAMQTLFDETFNNCDGTGGRDGEYTGNIGTSSTSGKLDESWVTIGSNGASECIKLGTSKAAQNVTTRNINVTGNGTLTFSAAGWGDENNNTLTVSAEGATLSGDTEITLEKGTWNSYTVNITEGTGDVAITFTMKRGFLDDVKVTKGGAPLSVTLNASGYATYCSQYPLDFTGDNDYSAWQITGISEDAGNYTIIFSEITDVIAGGQGILLKGLANTTIELASSADNKETLDNNKFVGTIAPAYVESNEFYGLKANNFVHVNAGVVPANKALLPANLIDSSVEVKGFTFVFEDMATGIRTIEKVTPAEAAEIFNLGGQRMNKVQRGINIVNGRKVLVK